MKAHILCEPFLLGVFMFKKIIVWLLPLLLANSAYPQIISASNMAEVHKVIQSVAEDKLDLVLFDVDMTLTVSDHPAMFYPSLKTHHTLYKSLSAGLDKQAKQKLLQLALMQNKQMMLEPYSMPLVRSLQSRYSVMAFTGVSTENGFSKWRFDKLKCLGFDFRSSSYKQEDGKVLTKGELSDGILYTNAFNKDEVLLDFLATVNHSPRRVIMIDDRIDILREVEKAIQRQGLAFEFLGIEYTYGHLYKTADIDATAFKEFWEAIKQNL